MPLTKSTNISLGIIRTGAEKRGRRRITGAVPTQQPGDWCKVERARLTANCGVANPTGLMSEEKSVPKSELENAKTARDEGAGSAARRKRLRQNRNALDVRGGGILLG